MIWAMEGLVSIRQRRGFSQRALAQKAGISYKALQLIESGKHNPELKTIQKLAIALGYGAKIFQESIEKIFAVDPDSLEVASWHMLHLKEWGVPFFDFVDSFRQHPFKSSIENPPSLDLPEKMKVLLASTVETLCDEQSFTYPCWCRAIDPLSDPWFVAERENLKAMSLVESPIHFRKRNIFVLDNFLSRA